MAQYTHTTLLSAKAALIDRLQNIGSVYWADSELTWAIQESLRDWQAHTAVYRNRVVTTSIAGQTFYDLTQLTPASYPIPATFSLTVSATDMYNQILCSLLEPAVYPYVGSTQFTGQQILTALYKRRNQFLLDTGFLQTTYSPPIVTPGNSRVVIDDSIVSIIRVEWVDQLTRISTPLFRADEFSANAFQLNSNLTPGTPISYSVSVTPPVSMSLFPPPANPGVLNLVVVQTPTGADPVPSVVTLFGIPDDFCHFVKYGALADLFSTDGQSRDPQRAAYCESRYQEGVQLARIFPSILNTQIGSTPAFTDTLYNFDCFTPNWRNVVSTQPAYMAVSGYNLFALYPTPNDSYGITLDACVPFPVPYSDGDYLQVGRETVDTILDYAQHVLSLKMGGSEFQITLACRQRSLVSAARMNSKLKAQSFYGAALAQPSQDQNKQVVYETL